MITSNFDNGMIGHEIYSQELLEGRKGKPESLPSGIVRDIAASGLTSRGRLRLGDVNMEGGSQIRKQEKMLINKKKMIKSIKNDPTLSRKEKKKAIKAAKSQYKNDYKDSRKEFWATKRKRYAAGGVNDSVSYSCNMTESASADNLMG